MVIPKIQLTLIQVLKRVKNVIHKWLKISVVNQNEKGNRSIKNTHRHKIAHRW